MAKVRSRKESGHLFIDFKYQGVRCREQTLLKDTQANRKRLELFAQTIQAKITLGEFVYAEFFPNSANLHRIPESRCSQKAENTTPPFDQFARQWQLEKNVEWRASHARNVTCVLESSLIAFFGNKALSDITKTDILNFRTQLAASPGRGGNELVSPKTVNTHMMILKGILEEASDRFNFENPYKNIKPLKLQRSHVEPFTLEEVMMIANKVRQDYRNYYLVRFYSGMRTGEIDGLMWEHVDFERRLIAVRETLVGGKMAYTKTDGSQRDIPMLGPVFEALKAQQAATGKLSRYVFCNAEGNPLDHNNVTKRVWYPLLRHLGLKKRRPYQTRHTAATLLLAAGENPEWVARFLGHTSTEMLFKVYSRYIPNLTRQDGSAFEHLLATRFLPATTESDELAEPGGQGTDATKHSAELRQKETSPRQASRA